MADHGNKWEETGGGASHRLRSILHVSLRDKILNKTIRERTEQKELGCIIRRRRLTWLGHVVRMNKDRRAKEVMNWDPGCLLCSYGSVYSRGSQDVI